MRRCPECGERPQYTSFCTTCAKLFRRPAPKWDRYWFPPKTSRPVHIAPISRHNETVVVPAVSAMLDAGATRREIAARFGKTHHWVEWLRRKYQLPAVRKRRQCIASET
jgi:hypothetical protein